MVTIVHMTDFCNLKHSYQLKSDLLRLASSSLKRDQIYLNLLTEKSHLYIICQGVCYHLSQFFAIISQGSELVDSATLQQVFSYHQMR